MIIVVIGIIFLNLLKVYLYFLINIIWIKDVKKGVNKLIEKKDI